MPRVKYYKMEGGGRLHVIPIHDLVKRLGVDDAITATTVMMEETALVHALVLIHGRERAIKRYIDSGGHMRFYGDGVVLLWPVDKDGKAVLSGGIMSCG